MKISVIIATLNEAANLPYCLPERLEQSDVEVIVADGGSCDETPDIAIGKGWKVCRSATGRSAQMNEGAKLASGNVLLFLHGDTKLPNDFVNQILRVLSEPNVVAGAFRLGITNPTFGMKIIERLANWRSVQLQMPYGDQAIFLSAEEFLAIGGFSDIPIMEDVELIRRLRKRGRIRIASASVQTSSRRWEKLGLWKTTAMNQACILAYYVGVSPRRIHRWYYGYSFRRMESSAGTVSTDHANFIISESSNNSCVGDSNRE